MRCHVCLRHAHEVKEEAEALLAKLQAAWELLEVWIANQAQVVLLGSLFRLQDLAKLLPHQAKALMLLERHCRGRLRDARLQPSILTVAATPGKRVVWIHLDILQT